LALQEISRKKPVLKNRVTQEIEDAVVALALEQPAFGQLRIAHELRKLPSSVTGRGAHYLHLRHRDGVAALRDLAVTKVSPQMGLSWIEKNAIRGAKTRPTVELPQCWVDSGALSEIPQFSFRRLPQCFARWFGFEI
jgi:hypothetical protein